MKVSAVLFDLDGTVADTAPDLGDALNRLLAEQKKRPLPFDEIRKHASSGARGLIDCSFNNAPLAEKQRLMTRFLDLYAERPCRKTRLFPGVIQTLEALTRHGIAWGIVTNKIRRFAEPILKNLGIHALAQCHVYGDTTEHKKPEPDSLLLAAQKLKASPESCLYIGDSERDTLAAKAANMPVLITAYGYESRRAADGLWNCQGVLQTFADLLFWIDDFPAENEHRNSNRRGDHA